MRLRRASALLLLTLVLIPLIACGRSEEELYRQELQEYFDASADAIRSTARRAVDEGRWQDAIDTSEPYAFIADPTLVTLGDSAKRGLEAEEKAAEEQRLLAEVRTVPASDAIRNRNLYDALKALDPENQLYQEKFGYYRQKAQEAKETRDAVTLRAQRRIYASQLENNFLDEGLNIYVTVHGSNYTTLRLKWILASRVTAHQMSTQSNFSSWRALGFKRVELRDGYDYSVHWDLD